MLGGGVGGGMGMNLGMNSNMNMGMGMGNMGMGMGMGMRPGFPLGAQHKFGQPTGLFDNQYCYDIARCDNF